MARDDFYQRRRAAVSRLLERYGTSLTLQHYQEGACDPASGEVAAAWSQRVLTGLVRDYRQDQVDGSLVLSGDRELILAGETETEPPRPGDRLVLAGETYTVVQVNTLEPGGLALLHRCQIRRA